MAQPRYITTLVRRLNQAYREEPKFDYGDSDRGRAIKEQIADALTFWRFYENLREHLTNIKNLPEDINVLRHELLERIAAEDTFRGFIACWLRLPPTVIETLKWSQNLDIQSRESFLRRLEFRQLQGVREAYDEFFEHRLVPTCMSDGVFRRIVHRHVTYETLKAEPLISRNRVVSKCAWGKNYAHMDFGHAKYPQGPADDVADSGAFRKFFSVKNHANDFAVNQHDGLYWFLYRTLRSNYIWNRNGDVKLHPMICPGFWFTILGWFFFAILSPLLALTITFPAFAGGGPEASFIAFGGFFLGMVTPLLLLIYAIFYIWRDTRAIVWLGQAIDNHFERRFGAWVMGVKILWFCILTTVFGLITLMLYVAEDAPVIYPAIGLLWLLSYWYFCFMDDTVAPSLDGNGRSVLVILGVSVLIAAAPYWSGILSFIVLAVTFVITFVTFFSFQLLLFGALLGAAYVVGTYTKRLRAFQTARTGVTTERVDNEYRLFQIVVGIGAAFYGLVVIWAAYTLLGNDSLSWAMLYPFAVLVVVLGLVWYVLTDAFEVQRIDPQVVVKRNAFANALRDAGEGDSSYLHYLIDNDWVINHDDPVRIGREIRLFVDRLTGGLEGATMLRYKGAQVIDAGTAKRFDAYTHDVVMSAYAELGSRYYSEFVLRAYEGYTPEQALQKAIKLKEQIQGKRTFWHESFPMRMLDKFVDFFEAIWYGIGKVFKDLFGMWRLLHKYCPAVAETKDI